MIDTHSHIYLEEFDEDREEVIARAKAAGIRHIILPNVDFDTFGQMHSLNIDHREYTSMAMGLHPESVGSHNGALLEQVDEQLATGNYVAVGEVGIDLYWDKTYYKEQRMVFINQINFAVKYQLPMIIHVRDGIEVIQDILGYFSKNELPQMDFHSFTGTPEDVRNLRKFGDFYFGVNGIVTFKNGHLEETVKEIGLNRILLETDSPYLAPVPNRGKRNESANIPYICAKIADILGVTSEEVSAETDKNAVKLFNLNLNY